MEIHIFNGHDDFLSGWQNAIKIRDGSVVPALNRGETVTLDFQGIRGTSQSWMNALVMGTLLSCGLESVRSIKFANCTPLVKQLVRFAVLQAERRTPKAA